MAHTLNPDERAIAYLVDHTPLTEDQAAAALGACHRLGIPDALAHTAALAHLMGADAGRAVQTIEDHHGQAAKAQAEKAGAAG